MQYHHCHWFLAVGLLAGVVSAALGAAGYASAAAAEKQVAGLRASHRAGQTMLSWQEVDPPVKEEDVAATAIRDLRREFERQKTPKLRYRIYRSTQPIATLSELKPAAEVPPLTCWNIDYYGDLRPEHKALRYVIEADRGPVAPGTGLWAFNPPQAGRAYYAVTAVMDGQEQTTLGPQNALTVAVEETVGQGVPVLQRVERPSQWQHVERPTLHYYVRWESPPHCAAMGKPFDYVVGVPPKLARPAPVGFHLHCWGGSLNGGYGWWYGAEQGHLLIASNQVPYDWWTGYHEAYWQGPMQQQRWQQGVVRPYSQTRMLAFLQWVATQWELDLTRTHVAGNSMGGSGAPMLAIRYPEQIAWTTAWVGVHVPQQSPTFKSSYTNVFGPVEWGVKFADGTPVWDHFNDAWYLRRHPEKEIGLIAFSNGKNDGGIGWPQAREFFRALQDTKRPHIFVWGQSGHGQRALLPVSLSDRHMPMDLRTDQSQPAFSACSLDDNPGSGDPRDGDPQGQANLYLFWETADIVDQPATWEVTLGLVGKAPKGECTVDVTPRRLQKLRLKPGQQVAWTNTPLVADEAIQRGKAAADGNGLITLPQVRVGKQKNRVRVTVP